MRGIIFSHWTELIQNTLWFHALLIVTIFSLQFPLLTVGNLGKTEFKNILTLFESGYTWMTTNLWTYEIIMMCRYRIDNERAFRNIIVKYILALYYCSRRTNISWEIIWLILQKLQHLRRKYFKRCLIPSCTWHQVSFLINCDHLCLSRLPIVYTWFIFILN